MVDSTCKKKCIFMPKASQFLYVLGTVLHDIIHSSVTVTIFIVYYD